MGTVISIPKREPLKKIRLKRVAAYCRVSTDNNAQLESLENQRQHFELMIRANPVWEFVGVYYDEGISGTRMDKRHGFQRLLEDVRRDCIDLVIVKTISRLARNTEDCLSIVRQITEHAANIFFEVEKINTANMEGEMLLAVLGSIAESESESISRNIRWGIQQCFRNGTFKIVSPPYGYTNSDDKLTVVPEEAEVVRNIFYSVLAGKGSRVIANELDVANIKPPRGSSWNESTVTKILTNEKYTGDVIFQKTYTDEFYKSHVNRGERDKIMFTDHHEDFQKVQDMMEFHREEKGILDGSKYTVRYPFSGRLICCECGGYLKRRTHNTGHKKL